MRIWTRSRSAVAMSAVGAVLLSGCTGSVFDVPLPGGADVGSDPITVHAEFRDVLDLVPQSTVKIDDVTVGKVSDIKLKGYTADVTLSLPKDVDLPDNAQASIRQTSLLGEKFVSLSAPASGPSDDRLGNGDTIPLARTGRNPEIEEVFGALSLILNGGGVGQLKTIASELNDTLGGREEDVRSVLDQLDEFVGQLDRNKAAIVSAIESLNRLAVQLKKQDGSIKLALDDLPAAIKSIDGQRADLVKTLKALQNLSGVGVRVIRASKTATINSLRDLAPVLDKIADSGDNFAKSIQVALTYPFIDEAVGRNPQAARNLHMGDYVNLDARLDLDLSGGVGTLPLPSISALPSVGPLTNQVCQLTTKVKQQAVDEAQKVVNAISGITGTQKTKILNDVLKAVNALDCNDPLNQKVLNNLLSDALGDILNLSPVGQTVKKLLGDAVKRLNGTLGGLTGGNGNGGGSGSGGGLLGNGGLLGGGGGLLGLGRTAPGFGSGKKGDALNGPAGDVQKLGYNSTLGALLLQGVVQ